MYVVKAPPEALDCLMWSGRRISRQVSPKNGQDYGAAPLPPVACDSLGANDRTDDAILYGGQVVLWVQADDEQLAEIGPEVPSSALPDRGAPFTEILARYEKDFYKLDPLLFSPAAITFQNPRIGRSHTFGGVEPDVLQHSFVAAT